jgi:hypothetical protein
MLVPSSQLTVNLTGRVSRWPPLPPPMFMLVVSNPGGSPVNNVNISAVIPGLPRHCGRHAWAGCMVSPGFGLPPVPQVGGPGVQNGNAFHHPSGRVGGLYLFRDSFIGAHHDSGDDAPVWWVRHHHPSAAGSPGRSTGWKWSRRSTRMTSTARWESGRHDTFTGLDAAKLLDPFENNPTATAPAHQSSLPISST